MVFIFIYGTVNVMIDYSMYLVIIIFKHISLLLCIYAYRYTTIKYV